MGIDDHGSCVHCGADLNGDYIYDTFLKKYGNPVDALAVASMYGAREGYGKWGREIYVKNYDEDWNKLTPYYKCPDCGERCYEQNRS